MNIDVRGSMRHVCTGCGGSCRGVVVRVSEEEAARVHGMAAELGVDEPIVGDALRRERGACVFLDPGGRCRLHARWGAESKPAICRQYPVVAVSAEGSLRVGIDPGCYSHATTWQTAEQVTGGELSAQAVHLSPEALGEEAQVLSLLDQVDAVQDALRALVGDVAGFDRRFAQRLREMDLGAVLDDPSLGVTWRAALRPLVGGPALAPPSQAHDAYALDATRRVVFLRLLTRLGSPGGAALLTLAGARALSRGELDGASFGAALAGWTRSLRSPPFLAAFLPDAGTLRWLVRGE